MNEIFNEKNLLKENWITMNSIIERNWEIKHFASQFFKKNDEYELGGRILARFATNSGRSQENKKKPKKSEKYPNMMKKAIIVKNNAF